MKQYYDITLHLGIYILLEKKLFITAVKVIIRLPAVFILYFTYQYIINY